VRKRSFQFVEASPQSAAHASGGGRLRRSEFSRFALLGGVAALALSGAVAVGSAGYQMFRDEILAGLLERQTKMQYAYEDRLAAARLRLDQVSSRQFIDRDGVEGKVQSLVMRQAMLETRAAVVAQLVERATHEGSAASPVARAPAPAPSSATLGSATPGSATPATAPIAAPDLLSSPQRAKPQPEGMDLRLGHDEEPAEFAPPAQIRPEERAAIDTGLSRALRTTPALADAADPNVPIPRRLESLALSLDHIERDQSQRLSSILRPTLAAAGRLRQAFDMAGLPAQRYIGKLKAQQAPVAMGGPFVEAEPKTGAAAFERDLASVQDAVATLDGLRRALPTVPFRKPLSGALQMTSAFGYRNDPFLGRPALHSGVDLRDEYGEPARATAAGVVTAAGPNGGYGNMVEVDHGDGLSTRYAHLSAITVSVGQRVAPGAIVGRIGSTGRSTGPHLHYEVRVDGEAVDPARFLRAASSLGSLP
jgi:murein DD-endopeptidase MepM/ murein hydrolase activator NlpD